MGYLVETSGRILLPEPLERQALTVLEVRMAARGGWFDADEHHVDTLGELAQYAGARVRREGDWLLVSTDPAGDPKWSEQAGEFYRTLSSFVREGEVHLRGEDGQVWSYLYSPEGVVQRGDNGYDGTPGDTAAIPTEPAPAPPAPPAAEDTPVVPPAPTTDPAPEPPTPPGAQPSQFQYPGREDRPTPPPGPTPGPTPEPPTAPYGQVPPAHEPSPQADPAYSPDPRVERAWADPPPASTGRTVLMATLLVVGVVLIIGLALLVSGL